MGIVNLGIPKGIVTELAGLAKASVFVETGTFRGDTTRWAAEFFEHVHTIELSAELFAEFHADLDRLPNVNTHHGDSATVLPSLLPTIGSRRAIHWLDGHWSCGETAGEERECPLVDELSSLAQRQSDLILIDDARLFLSVPPEPHDPAQWPTLTEIVGLFQGQRKRFIQVIDDVIFIVPHEEILVDALIKYGRQQLALNNSKPRGWRRMAGKLLGAA